MNWGTKGYAGPNADVTVGESQKDLGVISLTVWRTAVAGLGRKQWVKTLCLI